MSDANRRAQAVRAIQYLVGALALAWVVRQVEWGRALALLADVSPGTAAALVAVSVVGLAGSLYMWHVLLDSAAPTRFRDAVQTGLVVLFVNQLLPSRLSGRAVAPFVAHDRTGMPYADAIAVSGVHTGLYAVLYGATALVGVALGLGRLPSALVLVLLLSTGLYVAAGTVVLLAGAHMRAVDRVAVAVEALARRVPVVGGRLGGLTGTIPEFTAESAAAFRRLLTDPSAVAPYVAGYALTVLVVPGLRVWLLFESLGVAFEPLVALPLYLVAAYSVTLLPLTPGSVGVSEASATAVFVALGLPVAAVVPVVFVDRLLGSYLPALAGWYPSLRIDFSALASNASASE
ncbi:lysylphosphatidylglycerol synthase transmembrane domain-containing protein [Halosimplex aquaticum]|uniref:Lysylphosphatidylglycerol synthase transmembrane domain-containing protein n=1 Tax=Halosimplex aquaticum TaxID=3026162 RepID=A0ABD5XUG3_9EURY|nr:lysylphosphatidylglycerol synthase transmembrane domain-containing protein [Halosimplex aquaticum]